MQKYLVFVALFCIGVSLDLPSNFQKCKRSDSNVNECLKNAIQNALGKLEKGLPEFGMGPIQPLNVQSMTIGEGSGTVHVVQSFKNVNIYGIPDAKIEKVNIDIKEHSVVLDIYGFVSDLKLEAEYDFNGQILVVPIVGNGNCTIQLKDLKAHFTFMGEEFEKNGKNYIEMKKTKLELNPGKLIFNFKNLFNGDERLGAEMNKLLNDNEKDVFADVKSGYEEALAIVIESITNLIFKKVPLTDLLPL